MSCKGRSYNELDRRDLVDGETVVCDGAVDNSTGGSSTRDSNCSLRLGVARRELGFDVVNREGASLLANFELFFTRGTWRAVAVAEPRLAKLGQTPTALPPLSVPTLGRHYESFSPLS